MNITLKSFNDFVKGSTCFSFKYLKMLRLPHHVTFCDPQIIQWGDNYEKS